MEQLSSVFNPSDLNAASAYGVQLANISQVPTSGVDVKEMGSLSTSTSAGVTDHLSLHWNNPLFWFLLLLVLFVGYVGILFDFSVKRIGSVKVAGGKD